MYVFVCVCRDLHRYDFVYKQSVMAEDTFLGMAGKTPGSQVGSIRKSRASAECHSLRDTQIVAA